MIRMLLTTRAAAIEARTAALPALRTLVTTAPDELRGRFHRPSHLPTPDQRDPYATVMAMRSTSRRVIVVEREAAELEHQLEALVRQVARALLHESELDLW